MKKILHHNRSRGFFDHGWLKTHHTFSFADYHNPDRVHFGALRVLNDDWIAPGTGFDMHSHRDMEIVSIPLKGDLEHRDSMGHTAVIAQGEIQVMSAGSGIRHSEYNPNEDRPTEFLQIWVMTERINVEPRYENAVIRDLLRKNEITTIVSPYPGKDGGLWIYQQAWFSMGELEAGTVRTYRLKSGESHGVYVFMIEGEATVAGESLKYRDGLGIYDTDSFDIEVMQDAKLLLIEVPEYEF